MDAYDLLSDEDKVKADYDMIIYGQMCIWVENGAAKYVPLSDVYKDKP